MTQNDATPRVDPGNDDARPTGELEQSDIEYSRIDRLMMRLPEPPRAVDGLGLSSLTWIALGVSHGAWLIKYDVFHTDYVIWGAAAIAFVSVVVQYVE